MKNLYGIFAALAFFLAIAQTTILHDSNMAAFDMLAAIFFSIQENTESKKE